MSDVVLKICGLEYRVVYATADQVPELAGKEGYTDFVSNTIYIRSNLTPCRSRDVRMHEVAHSFLEASGIGSFLSDRVRGDYDKFEETLIRLVVQPILRLVDENGAALVHVPPTKKRPLAKTAGAGRSKTTRGKR